MRAVGFVVVGLGTLGVTVSTAVLRHLLSKQETPLAIPTTDEDEATIKPAIDIAEPITPPIEELKVADDNEHRSDKDVLAERCDGSEDASDCKALETNRISQSPLSGLTSGTGSSSNDLTADDPILEKHAEALRFVQFEDIPADEDSADMRQIEQRANNEDAPPASTRQPIETPQPVDSTEPVATTDEVTQHRTDPHPVHVNTAVNGPNLTQALDQKQVVPIGTSAFEPNSVTAASVEQNIQSPVQSIPEAPQPVPETRVVKATEVLRQQPQEEQLPTQADSKPDATPPVDFLKDSEPNVAIDKSIAHKTIHVVKETARSKEQPKEATLSDRSSIVPSLKPKALQPTTVTKKNKPTVTKPTPAIASAPAERKPVPTMQVKSDIVAPPPSTTQVSKDLVSSPRMPESPMVTTEQVAEIAKPRPPTNPAPVAKPDIVAPPPSTTKVSKDPVSSPRAPESPVATTEQVAKISKPSPPTNPTMVEDRIAPPTPIKRGPTDAAVPAPVAIKPLVDLVVEPYPADQKAGSSSTSSSEQASFNGPEEKEIRFSDRLSRLSGRDLFGARRGSRAEKDHTMLRKITQRFSRWRHNSSEP